MLHNDDHEEMLKVHLLYWYRWKVYKNTLVSIIDSTLWTCLFTMHMCCTNLYFCVSACINWFFLLFYHITRPCSFSQNKEKCHLMLVADHETLLLGSTYLYPHACVQPLQFQSSNCNMLLGLSDLMYRSEAYTSRRTQAANFHCTFISILRSQGLFCHF